MKNYDEWKRKLFERVKSEVYNEIEWNSFSNQVDNFVNVYGVDAFKNGRIPPHGKYEFWLPNKLEHEIMREYKKAAIKEGLTNEQQKKDYSSIVS